MMKNSRSQKNVNSSLSTTHLCTEEDGVQILLKAVKERLVIPTHIVVEKHIQCGDANTAKKPNDKTASLTRLHNAES